MTKKEGGFCEATQKKYNIHFESLSSYDSNEELIKVDLL